MNFITLLVFAPLAGAQKRNPSVIHAITLEAGMDGFRSGRMPTAACGAQHLRYVASSTRQAALLWPIRSKGELTRCRECWVATGKRRPRMTTEATS